MALPLVKTTYAIDLETKRLLDHLADRWEVSKSEALRRAVRHAAGSQGASERLAALDALQGRLKLSRSAASTWVDTARVERRRSSSKRRPSPAGSARQAR
jgi:hypothetical protein